MEPTNNHESSSQGEESHQTMNKCLKQTKKFGLVLPFTRHGHNPSHSHGRSLRLFPHLALMMLLACGLRAWDSLGPLKSTRTFLQTQNLKSRYMYKGVNKSRIVSIPSRFNRFNSPWYVPHPVQPLTLTTSRNRVLYSPLREAASDGIGHAFGTMNAEVGAALRLGLSYTHRVASYGSISKIDRLAVENFFGWGFGEIDRSSFRDMFCLSSYDDFHMSCQVCDAAATNKSFPSFRPMRVVQIPANLTYSRRLCGETDPDGLRMQCILDVRSFLRENNEPNTIFQMPLETCANSPVDRYPDPGARAFFFHKYWALHGRPNPSAKVEQETAMTREMGSDPFERLRIQRPTQLSRRALDFKEDRLVLAVHARRGDFFEVKRDMVSCKNFGVSIREVMRIIHSHGGVFSKLPVAVYIYSEGRAKPGIAHMGHDIRLMTPDFIDSDGIVRDAEWITGVIRGSQDDTFDFPNGLEVNLRIATDTIQSMHEMVAADVFFGSHSALGRFVVGTLFRGGLHLLPENAIIKPFNWRCCTIPFSSWSGKLHGREHAIEYWRAYADANENSARVAWRSRRRRVDTARP